MQLRILCALLLFINIILPGFAANINRNSYNSGQYNSQYQGRSYVNSRNYYNSRYNNNNLDHYYNHRAYYDSHYKNYNPNVVAPNARIIGQDFKTPDNGVYAYSFETENGIQAEEHANPITISRDEQTEAVEGSYSFFTPEGLHVIVRYTADDHGFHPIITYGGIDATTFSRRAQPADVVLNQRK